MARHRARPWDQEAAMLVFELEELRDEWLGRLEAANRSQGTIAFYRKRTRRVLDWFRREFPLNRERRPATTADVGQGDNGLRLTESFVEWYAPQVAASTLERTVTVWTIFLDWCRKRGYIASHAVHDLDPIRVPTRLRHWLDQEERDRVRAIWDTRTPEGTRNRLLFDLLLDTGCRLAEICNLRVDRVETAGYGGGGRITVIAKRDQERVRPVGVEVTSQLRRWLGRNGPRTWFLRDADPGTVLLSREGRPLSPERAYHAIVEAGKAAGIHVHPHMLRRTFAVEHAAAGVNPWQLREAMGHASITTTQRYVDAARKQAAVAWEQTRSLVDQEERKRA
jgi:integrase/recombinase XerC